MRTCKPISTISYNTKEFLIDRLDKLLKDHKISFYVMIWHFPEVDEKKGHWHLLIFPNTLLDSMDIQDYLTEVDPMHPKPLRCIDFRSTRDIDDWILYSQHYRPYLLSKMEDREYMYNRSDFICSDEDTFDDLYRHAFHGSKWAQGNQIIEQLKTKRGALDLINNQSIPLALAQSAYVYQKLRREASLDRGDHRNHEFDDDM